jgi:mannose-6-phosphate isomerase-like protein (cupin superfamily)
MKIVHNDGTDVEIGPGDVVNIPAGHDAWVVGDEKCGIVDRAAGNDTYAKR